MLRCLMIPKHPMDCEDRSLRVHICCDVWGNQLGFLDGLEIRTGLLKSTAQGQGFRTGVMSSACPQFPTPRPYSVITGLHSCRSAGQPITWFQLWIMDFQPRESLFSSFTGCLYLLTPINCLGTERPSLAGAMNSQPHPALQPNLQKFPGSLTGSPTSSLLNRADSTFQGRAVRAAPGRSLTPAPSSSLGSSAFLPAGELGGLRGSPGEAPVKHQRVWPQRVDTVGGTWPRVCATRWGFGESFPHYGDAFHTCHLEMPKGAERHFQPGGPTVLHVL